MVLYGVKLFYPSAREWMWDYCIYLGPFTDSHGDNFDLGIYINDWGDDKLLGFEKGEFSAAIVYGNEPGNYLSGPLNIMGLDDERYKEVVRRGKELNLF